MTICIGVGSERPKPKYIFIKQWCQNRDQGKEWGDVQEVAKISRLILNVMILAERSNFHVMTRIGIEPILNNLWFDSSMLICPLHIFQSIKVCNAQLENLSLIDGGLHCSPHLRYYSNR